jgi:acyl carrier protein
MRAAVGTHGGDDRTTMTRKEIRARVERVLLRLVPEFDLNALRPDASLREALAADSMDVLNFVTALHSEFGVDIPELDYRKVDTLDGCVDYVATALGKPGGRP